MKYNSIGQQLIAKAKEIDPSYRDDKFNDMSEAIDILLNNSGGGSSEEILELNATDSATLVNILNGEVEGGQKAFSTNYPLKDYDKVKISMNGVEGYYGISNKMYSPNTMLQFDIFNNYGDNGGLSLDYVRVNIIINTEFAIYELWKIRLPIIN